MSDQKAIPQRRPVGRPGVVEDAQLPDPPARTLTPPPTVQAGPRPPAPTDQDGALSFDDRPAPAYATRAVTLHLSYHGVPVDLYRADLGIETIEQLIDGIIRREGWAAHDAGPAPLAAPIATPDDLPEGWKLCPKHHAPMRPRNKQGDVWHSHNVGTQGSPIYCKGYKGADSPGYDVE